MQIKHLYIICLRRKLGTASDVVHDIQRENRPSVKGVRYKFGILQDPSWEDFFIIIISQNVEICPKTFNNRNASHC